MCVRCSAVHPLHDAQFVHTSPCREQEETGAESKLDY